MIHKRLMGTIITAAIIMALVFPAWADDTNHSREIIMSAMRDEMNRSLGRLEIKGMERPFFISYNIFDSSATEILATLGSVVRTSETRNRNHIVRVMVGDYTLNDENFQGRGSHGSSTCPSTRTRNG